MKAEVLTKATGVSLGNIVTIDYSWGEIEFVSRPMEHMMMNECLIKCAEPAGGAYNIDIDPEDIEVQQLHQDYRQCPVIAEASDFPRTFPNMSKRSFSLTLIGAYFSLSEIRKIPSLSFCNFLI